MNRRVGEICDTKTVIYGNILRRCDNRELKRLMFNYATGRELTWHHYDYINELRKCSDI